MILIENINAIINLAGDQAEDEESIQSIDSIIKLKYGILKDEENLFSPDWAITIRNPLNNTRKVGDFIIKFEQRMSEVHIKFSFNKLFSGAKYFFLISRY